MKHLNDRILVTGASGQLGGVVVEELLRLGAGHVVAASRTPEKLGHFQGRGVEVRGADFDRPETLRSAFAEVDRLAIISTDALDVPGKRLNQHRAAIAAAVESGVKHVVYTSAPAPHPTGENSLINDHFWTEAAIFAATFTWTILRNHLYMDLIPMTTDQAIKSGKLFSATDGKARSYVSREDCGRSIAGSLVQAEGSEILDVTGSASVMQDELAAMLGRLTGKPLAHIDVTPEQLTEGLAHSGLPPHMIKVIVDFDVEASQGYHAIVTPIVERLTGVRPVTLEDFLRKHLNSA